MSTHQNYLTTVIRAPIISEKSTLQAEANKIIAFKVLKQATKKQIKDAVELMFNVEVDNVNVLNVQGKQKRFGRTLGKKSDWKKAYVKLKPGHDIDFSAA
ncbi:50S ribosomal protein L23 [Candidatus Methylomicrobium oryzae]|jgi:large subunit ribosomal protein L23|uniref:50S ribosomal protein L23 n=1 Tax=Candidatus Methylomicrobium oryzae TaxID=2802053 RepID=UPI001920C6FE|nr:50S ribosomal protein L23 [Methylomicrobium sp. RS1]MBL1262156.1 50S ribosomal protein L23 [Methylomicrobium sp. RS1]